MVSCSSQLLSKRSTQYMTVESQSNFIIKKKLQKDMNHALHLGFKTIPSTQKIIGKYLQNKLISR